MCIPFYADINFPSFFPIRSDNNHGVTLKKKKIYKYKEFDLLTPNLKKKKKIISEDFNGIKAWKSAG